MRKILLSILCLFVLISLKAQETFPLNDVYDTREELFVFTNATIFKSYNERLDNASLIIRKGKVEAIGKSLTIPKNAVVIDLKGKFIYPSFIDLHNDYGMPSPKKQEPNKPGQQKMVSGKKGAYLWNEAMHPEFKAHEHFKADEKTAATLRKAGFGVVLSNSMNGICRGTSTLVTLSDKRAHELIIKKQVGHHLSFSKGNSTQSYPSSLMGGIALIRQTHYDGQWYKNGGYEKETNLSLEAWNEVISLPSFFEVRSRIEAMRAAKIGKEFGVTYTIIGAGDEYRRLENIKALNAPFIVPVNFPKPFDLTDPYDARIVSLAAMKSWELAPTNAAKLAEANIEFTLTSSGLKNKEDFLSNIRKAINHGLSEEDALKAITHTPAKLIDALNLIGSLEKGKLANFIITSENIFKKDSKIHHNWIKGKAFVFKKLDAINLDGMYNLKVGVQAYNLAVKGGDNPKITIKLNDTTDIKVTHKYSDGLITLSFKPDKNKGIIALSGTVTGNNWSGNGTLEDGTWVKWSTNPTRALVAPEKEKDTDKKPNETTTNDIGKVLYPFMAYGWEEAPKSKNYLIKNATIWTNEKEGILETTDVLIENGKIAGIGKNLIAAGAIEIDGTGKHLTSGIIDEHSHIAVSRGVNECTQTSTAEVRIGDVINSEDINIYRQLAGGVTTAQLLHGSCNPIGGQSALIKMRWGFTPEEMKFENADGFIKFALGENVKNSRTNNNNRFPDTRMGVEQVYVDAFTRARAYEKQKSTANYRRDLDLETILEVMNSQRFVTCHSYVQSEINMLMHVAEAFGFRVNTFTHILEGYKLADKMKAHGAGGSSFSDWWAYKFEVIDAIPYNGAILHNEGIITAFNSDDAEMGRRLNQEAAKAVMYGNISEEEAWKFVTLNPAKLLHIDNRVGSIKEGKDADLVLWSENPLSIYAKADYTFVDGIQFFDREADKAMRLTIQKERARLIQKMITAKNGGASTQPAKGEKIHHYHCDDGEDEMH